MDEIIKDPLETVKPTDVHQKLNPLLEKSDEHLSVSKKSQVSELLFIQSNDEIIEKQLGKNENSIKVLKTAIIGFSEGIKFSKCNDFLVSVSGVGIVYIETQTREMKENEGSLFEDPELV